MALYIVQHGKSMPKELDPERGLSEEGRMEVERITKVARDYGVKVTSIVHSGKKRSSQTAEIIAGGLKPAHGLIQRNGMDPLDKVEPLAKTIDPGTNVMLVGHLPFLERLIAYLITGNTEIPVFKLQNGGILCMDQVEGAWVIKWALMPHIT